MTRGMTTTGLVLAMLLGVAIAQADEERGPAVAPIGPPAAHQLCQAEATSDGEPGTEEDVRVPQCSKNVEYYDWVCRYGVWRRQLVGHYRSTCQSSTSSSGRVTEYYTEVFYPCGWNASCSPPTDTSNDPPSSPCGWKPVDGLGL